MNWHDYYVYDEESPSGLRWKITRYKGKSYKQIAAEAGSVAGSAHTDDSNMSYWKVKLNSKQHGASVIIYEMFNGPVREGFVVDHINGNGLDNRIENLRQVHPKINARNQAYRVSQTGVIGVTKEAKRIRAVWYNVDGVRESKSFSIPFYGEAVALELATKARIEAILKLNQSGAGYTDRHGEINGKCNSTTVGRVLLLPST